MCIIFIIYGRGRIILVPTNKILTKIIQNNNIYPNNRLLKTTMEEILPTDYYTQGMIGVRTDERVLKELLAQKLPKISQHLEKNEIVLSGFVTAWFMSLYINILPLEVFFFFPFIFWMNYLVLGCFLFSSLLYECLILYFVKDPKSC